MSLYNVVFSALVPLIVGTMDVDVSKEMSRKYPGKLGLSRGVNSMSCTVTDLQAMLPFVLALLLVAWCS